MRRNLKNFSSKQEVFLKFKLIQAIWVIVHWLLFNLPIIPSLVRVFILRLFFAKIGRGVVLRHRVRVHKPWNLEVGDYCWIGEDVWFINHERIIIDSDVCISQRAMICSGSHDYRSSNLQYLHKPIHIKHGAWVCMDSKILPGITIGECSVISAGEIVRDSVPNFSLLINGKIRKIDNSQ